VCTSNQRSPAAVACSRPSFRTFDFPPVTQVCLACHTYSLPGFNDICLGVSSPLVSPCHPCNTAALLYPSDSKYETNLMILSYRLFIAWNRVHCKQQSGWFWSEFNRGRYPRMLCWRCFIISLDKRRWCVDSWTDGQHITTWILHVRMQCIHGLRPWLELSIFEKRQWIRSRLYLSFTYECSVFMDCRLRYWRDLSILRNISRFAQELLLAYINFYWGQLVFRLISWIGAMLETM